MLAFQEVGSSDQIADVARLAREIWVDHYVSIVGRDQVEYMLRKFQSEPAIAAQLSEGYAYFLVSRAGQYEGYVAVVPDERDASLLVSKLYVRRSTRGQGVGKAILNFVEEFCRERRIQRMWLTVNKNNLATIAWYLRMGFRNAGPVVQDIGGGFVMDDFKMVKEVHA